MCTVQVRMSGVRHSLVVLLQGYYRLAVNVEVTKTHRIVGSAWPCSYKVRLGTFGFSWSIVSLTKLKRRPQTMLILSVYLGALHRDARWGYSKKPNCLSDLFGTAQVNKKKELWEDVSNLAVVFWREIWEGREKWVQVKGILLWPGFLITVVTSKVKEVPTNSSGGGELDKMKE